MHSYTRTFGAKGFTLIELAIVLVIIGLVAGSVLAGRSLIQAAENRAAISAIEQIKTAVNTFRGKYNELPGDITTATTYWGADATCPNTSYNTVPKTATCNGNGNGQIGVLGAADEYEAVRFWQHLANAGLIAGSYTGVMSAYYMIPGVNVPAGPIANSGFSGLGWYCETCVPAGTYYQNGNYGYVIYYGTNRTGNDVTDYPVVSPAQAYAIDSKIDDGLPATGIVQSLKPTWTGAANCATSSTNSAVYNTSYSGIACPMLFTTRF